MKFKIGDVVKIGRITRGGTQAHLIEGKIRKIDNIQQSRYCFSGNPDGVGGYFWLIEEELSLVDTYNSSVGEELMREVRL